ncbi:molybdenum cofactor guanylyltransferase [Coraliomargarita parva]|uniref:molybdenum cofactor guanylyltransferase n=1 Tax=Coraliomargarita parva TaxID=3014050 RepID=UPI0022B42B65|nr:NTP transferase domain-containing protein [Coraliomargarita parva]
MHKELYGLVLVGGESRRMGRDKALLSYDGKSTQLERTADLLQKVCLKVFISQRKEQAFESPAGTEAIYDSMEDVHGPLCGILSAMQKYPEADWLVLACDLPHLEIATLEKLLAAYRSRTPRLTAYRSSHDDLPEPLCAVYPAGMHGQLYDLAHNIGRFCPRKLLIVKEAVLVDQEHPHSLDNINTTKEYESLTHSPFHGS